MISLDQVSKTYTQKGKLPVAAVSEVSLNISEGEFVVITGRSGSGKTTLLNLAAGLAQPTGGEVHFGDTDLWKLSDPQRSNLRNKKMGFVFQFPSLHPSLSVLENVLLPTLFLQGDEKTLASARAGKLLEDVGLIDKITAYPRHLSAGQQQRVVIARSLINSPKVLLADEPTSNLDEQSEQEIIALFQDIHAKSGITILLVTHSGQIVTSGTRKVILSGGVISSDEKVN
jgi:ABC-type lipoprotein export system ATPase subunit